MYFVRTYHVCNSSVARYTYIHYVHCTYSRMYSRVVNISCEDFPRSQKYLNVTWKRFDFLKPRDFVPLSPGKFLLKGSQVEHLTLYLFKVISIVGSRCTIRTLLRRTYLLQSLFELGVSASELLEDVKRCPISIQMNCLEILIATAISFIIHISLYFITSIRDITYSHFFDSIVHTKLKCVR